MTPTPSISAELSGRPDAELMLRYAAEGDRAAFAVLVRRYWGLVVAAGRRQVGGDAALADDVAQAVFIVLARKAGSIRPDLPLPAWLLGVARHAARNATKMRARQQHHERIAAQLRLDQELMAIPPADAAVADAEHLRHARGLLDESIARLPAIERSGVVLHFFAGQTHEQVGRALGLSAEAARKRVARGLEKMRAYLVGQGVATAVGAEVSGVVAILHAERVLIDAIAPSADVMASTVNVAVLSASTSGAGGAAAASVSIANGASHMIALAKLKAAATVGLAFSLAAAAAVGGSIWAGALRGPAVVAVSTVTTVEATAAALAAVQPPRFTAEVDGQTKIEFLGISAFPPAEGTWHNLAGEPIDAPAVPLGEFQTDPPPEHVLAIAVTKPRDVVVQLRLDNAMVVANQVVNSEGPDGGDLLMSTAFALANPQEAASLRIGIATDAWTTLAEYDTPAEEGGVDAGAIGRVAFAPVRQDEDGRAVVEATYPDTREPLRMVAVDAAGREVPSNRVMVNGDGETCVGTYTFDDLRADEIGKLVIQARPYSKVVDVTGISLSPNHRTEPKITILDGKDAKD